MTDVTKKNTPIRVALTGGIGSGKSTALLMFHARGAAVLNSDEVVHQLLEAEKVLTSIEASLGTGPLPAGEEGRRRLAEIVFTNDEMLDRLEAIIFPLVAAEIERWLDTPDVAAAPLAVIELSMLFEAGMEAGFDKVVLVTAPEEMRLLRHDGRGEPSDYERRSARHLHPAEKLTPRKHTSANTGPPE